MINIYIYIHFHLYIYIYIVLFNTYIDIATLLFKTATNFSNLSLLSKFTKDEVIDPREEQTQ